MTIEFTEPKRTGMILLPVNLFFGQAASPKSHGEYQTNPITIFKKAAIATAIQSI